MSPRTSIIRLLALLMGRALETGAGRFDCSRYRDPSQFNILAKLTETVVGDLDKSWIWLG